MENTLKENKRIWRILQDYFAVYWEYANQHKSEPISANFRPNPPKIVILNHFTGHDRMGEKTISRYCPFNETSCNFLHLQTLFFSIETPNFEELGNFKNSVSQKSLNCSAPDELHAPKKLVMFCTWGTLCPEKKGWNALHLRNTRRLKKSWNVLYLRTLYSGRLEMGALYHRRDRNVLCLRNSVSRKSLKCSVPGKLCVPKTLKCSVHGGILCSEKAWNFSAFEELCGPKELEMFCTWGTLCPKKKGWNALHLRNTRRLKKLEMFCIWELCIPEDLKCSVSEELFIPEEIEMFCARGTLCPGKGWNVLCLEELCVPKKLWMICT